MGPFKANKAAKYRAEGLTLIQADRMETSLSRDDFKRTLLIAGLAFALVGSISYIAMQSGSSAADTQRLAMLNVPTQPVIAQPPVVEAPETSAVAAAPETPAIQAVPAPDVSVQITAAPQPPQAIAVPQQPILETATSGITAETVATLASAQLEQTAAKPCYAELAEIAARSTIFFDLGSALLDNADLTQLSALAEAGKECPSALIHVKGHSDTTGNDLINLDLSWQRADNTVSAIAQMGALDGQFEPVGFGARSPVSQGDTSDEELNRRVEFVVIRAPIDSQ